METQLTYTFSIIFGFRCPEPNYRALALMPTTQSHGQRKRRNVRRQQHHQHQHQEPVVVPGQRRQRQQRKKNFLKFAKLVNKCEA